MSDEPEPDRPVAPMAGPEREQLTGFLDWQRATAVWKSAGLTDEQARRRVVPSELTTIAGLVSHLRWVEYGWFEVVVDGRPDRAREFLGPGPDPDFTRAMRTPVTELIAEYEAQCAISREIVARHDLDENRPLPPDDPRGHASVRWVLIHMIEETARHAGHLDLIREMIDGLTGQ